MGEETETYFGEVFLTVTDYTLFFFVYKNKVYKNAEPQIWSNVKNILDAQISSFLIVLKVKY